MVQNQRLTASEEVKERLAQDQEVDGSSRPPYLPQIQQFHAASLKVRLCVLVAKVANDSPVWTFGGSRLSPPLNSAPLFILLRLWSAKLRPVLGELHQEYRVERPWREPDEVLAQHSFMNRIPGQASLV